MTRFPWSHPPELIAKRRHSKMYATGDPVNYRDPAGLALGITFGVGCLGTCGPPNSGYCPFGHTTSAPNSPCNGSQELHNPIQVGISLLLAPAAARVSQAIGSIKAEAASLEPPCQAGNIAASNGITTAGLAVAASVSHTFRWPDFISVEVSGGDYGFAAGAVATFTRYGSVFVGPEAGAGVPGVSATAEAGWIDQLSTPGINQVNQFVASNSVAANGYAPFFGPLGPAAAEVWGDPLHGGWASFATQIGLGSGDAHNAGLLWSYGNHVSDSGPKW